MKNIKNNLVEVHILNKNTDKFLLLQRSENEIYPDIWQMVSGKKKKKETSVKAAIRELKEETGLKPNELYVVPKINSLYLGNSDEIIFVPVFLAIVDENDIKLSSEHSRYRWCSFKDTIDLLAWPGQKEVVEMIYKYWNNNKEKVKFVKINLISFKEE